MIEAGMDALVERSKKKKKWKPGPDAPLAKYVQLKKLYTKVPEVVDALKLYEFFREI